MISQDFPFSAKIIRAFWLGVRINIMKNTSLIILLSLLFIFGTATSLSAIQEERSVEGLIYELESPEANVRMKAAEALGNHKIREAIPKLIKMTSDPDKDVRYEVARALVRINDTRALQAYIAFSRDEQVRVQREAVEGIVNVYTGQDGGFTQGMKKAFQFLNPLDEGGNRKIIESYFQGKFRRCHRDSKPHFFT